MHAAVLIKILLKITLFGFMFTTRGSNDYVPLDESGNNTHFLNKFLVGISILLITWSKFTKQL